MRAKLCGIQTLEAAKTAIENGAWALGFNFYPPSPRYIDFDSARGLISSLAKDVVKVGIFIDVEERVICQKMSALNLDFAQVYTHQPRPKSLMKRMILALQAKDESQLPHPEILSQYGMILLDSPPDKLGRKGGMGVHANWELAARLAASYRLILAGGLSALTLPFAASSVKPFAVDVASGVERQGVKDERLMRAFLKQAKELNDEYR